MDEIVLSDQKTIKDEKINEFEYGLRPDGKRIGEYKDAEYAIFKDHINPKAGGYVDLLLKREFSGGMYLKKFAKGYLFDSTDSKRDNLISRYGLDIMGVSQEWFDQRQKDVYRYTLSFQIQKVLNKA